MSNYIFWLILIVDYGMAQVHMLKYVNAGQSFSPGTAAQFTSATPEADLSNTRNKFANADRICLSGMWALYNSTFYGQGAEDTTTVISVRATDINSCTRSGQIPVLRSIQSVHYLGNADYGMNGLLIYSQPYYLGGRWNHEMLQELPAGINGFPLGSLAITGESAWLICDNVDCTNGICINMRNYGKLYLLRNAVTDTTLANGWPRIVRRVMMVSPEICANYINPTINPRRKKLTRRSTTVDGHIEIDLFDSS